MYANTILTKLTGNANYPTPIPSLLLLQTAIDNLNAAIDAANPSSVTIESKERYLEKVLYALKGYVELACEDDVEKAVSSGFELSQNVGTRPKVFTVKQGQLSGRVDLQCPYKAGAAYVWEYIADPINQNTWLQFKVSNTTTTTTTTTLSGLTPGTKYWFRVKAVVNDVDQPYTDPHLVHVV